MSSQHHATSGTSHEHSRSSRSRSSLPSPLTSSSDTWPSWTICEDIFYERYGKALNVTLDSWKPLPQLKALSRHSSSKTSCSSPASTLNLDKTTSPLLEPWLLNSVDPQSSQFGAAGRATGTDSHRRLLFQYKPYSKQEPLLLSDQDVVTVLETAFGKLPLGPEPSESTTNTSTPIAASTPPLLRPSPATGGGIGSVNSQSPADIACVVLIKLIIDLYLAQGPQVTFPLVHFILQRALTHGDAAAKARVFDLIINLAVHGEILYDAPADQVPEDDAVVVEAVSRLDPAGPSGDWRQTVTSALRASLAAGLNAPHTTHNHHHSHLKPRSSLEMDEESQNEWPPLPRPAPVSVTNLITIDPRGQRFRQWLRLLLFRMLSLLCSITSTSPSGSTELAWTAAVSAVAALGTHEGLVVRSFLEEMPLEAAAIMLQQAKEHSWPDSLRTWLYTVTANLFYAKPLPTTNDFAATELNFERLEAFGGIGKVAQGYVDAPTLQSQRAFFCVLLDYLGCTTTTPSTSEMKAINETIDRELAQVRALLTGVHASQLESLGAALLYCRAAEALHSVLSIPNSGDLESIARDLSSQIGIAQSNHPEAVIQPLCGLIEECLTGIQKIIKISLSGSSSPPERAENVDSLSAALKDKSNESQAAMQLTKMLIDLAKSENIAAAAANKQQCTAFLPAPPSTTTSHWKQSNIQPLNSSSSTAVEPLVQVLSQALPDPQSFAASAFAEAVCGLLDYVQLVSSSTTTDAGVDVVVAITMATVIAAVDWLNLAPLVLRQRAIAKLAEKTVEILTVREIDPSFSTKKDESSLIAKSRHQLSVRSASAVGTTSGHHHQQYPPQQQQHSRSSSFAHTGSGHRPEIINEPIAAVQQQQQQQRPASSPLAKFAPVPKLAAAWRRLTGPASGANTLTAARLQSEPHQEHPQQQQQQQQLTPPPSPPPPTSPQERRRATRMTTGSGPSLLGLAAQRAVIERQTLADISKGRLIALAVAEMKVTAVESFLCGLSQTTPELLENTPQNSLRVLFEALKPETFALQLPLAPTTPSAAAASSNRASPIPNRPGSVPTTTNATPNYQNTQSRFAAVQAGRPLWDARAALAMLLLEQQQKIHNTAARGTIDANFVAGLLSDSDPRVKRRASSFVLSRFAQLGGQQYRIALRDLVAKAQRNDDERLLRNPEAQVTAMLESRLIDLEALLL